MMTKVKRHRAIGVAVLVCTLVVAVNLPEAIGSDDQIPVASNRPEKEEEASQSKARMIIDAAQSLFSVPSYSYYSWPLKMKQLFQSRFGGLVPNLDFRRGKSRDEDIVDGGGEEGAAEKVKEAVVKSLDKSKSTVEDSAKTAANLAEKAVDKTLHKAKRTFSGKPDMEQHHEPQEL